MRLSVPLDTLTALYHRRSGQTHLITEPVPEILDALAHGPLTLTELTSRLETEGLVIDADTSALLRERLNELETIGLVSRA